MSERAIAAAVLLGTVVLAGCREENPAPSSPRAAGVATSLPSATPTAPAAPPADVVHVPGVPRASAPPAFPRTEEPLRPGGEVTEPVAFVRVLPDCRALVGAPVPIAVEVVVTREGKVERARVLSAAPEAVQEVARQHALGWRFRPATFNGRPVPVFYTIALNCS